MSILLPELDRLISKYFRPRARFALSQNGKLAGNADVRVPADGGSGPTLLLNIDRPDCDDKSGLCTVHIAVKPGVLAPATPNGAGGSFNRNGRLIAHVKWNTGNMIGECDLDITGGAIFTCSGTQGIDIRAQQVTADEAGAGDDGAPALVPGEELIVNAGCAWEGQAGPPRAAFMSGLRQKCTAATPSNLLAIPDNAQSVRFVTDTTANPLQIAFFDTGLPLGAPPPVGATPRWIQDIRLTDPGQFTLPIMAGIRSYSVTATKNSKVTAHFDMII